MKKLLVDFENFLWEKFFYLLILIGDFFFEVSLFYYDLEKNLELNDVFVEICNFNKFDFVFVFWLLFWDGM